MTEPIRACSNLHTNSRVNNSDLLGTNNRSIVTQSLGAVVAKYTKAQSNITISFSFRTTQGHYSCIPRDRIYISRRLENRDLKSPNVWNRNFSLWRRRQNWIWRLWEWQCEELLFYRACLICIYTCFMDENHIHVCRTAKIMFYSAKSWNVYIAG